MLFIVPSIDKISQPRFVREFTYACFPTSIGFLAAYLRGKNKDEVQVLDEQILDITRNMLERELSRMKHPKIVGISNLTVTTKRVIELAREIKYIDPKVMVVLGGVHPTVVPEQILNKSGADIVVRKEGEITLSELYDCLKNERGYFGIKGISYKKGFEIVHNPDREILVNLDEIPPFAYDLFEDNLDRYKDFGTIVASRGCPFSCIFCSQRAVSGNAYRYFSVPRVIDDIKKLVDKYGQKKIWFMEDNLAINKKRLFDLLDGIIASGYHKKVAFIGTMRGKDATYEILERLKECNFVSLGFGVETGSERLMKILDKKELVEDNVRAIKMCKEVGILSDAALIFGLPSETRKDRYETLKLICKLPLDCARVNIAIPFPGTKLYSMGKSENALHIHSDWTNCNNQYYIHGDDLPYVPQGTHPSVLIFDTMLANMAFNLRPQALYKVLFKSPLSGAGVVSLPKRWYLNPATLLSLIRFVYMISGRILIISIRVLFISVTRQKAYRVNEIKE